MRGTYQEEDPPLGEKLDVGDVPDEAELVEHDAGGEEAEDLRHSREGRGGERKRRFLSERRASDASVRGGNGERYFTGLALMTRKAGTTRTVTPRKVSVSKPRSLITSTAALARSMSIAARGGRKRPLLAAAAESRAGLNQARRRHGRSTQHTGAEASRAGARRMWFCVAAAAAAAAAAAMAPR
jgi:hypothetical protein